MSKMSNQTTVMNFSKSTKNTHVYTASEPSDDAPVAVVYVKRFNLPKSPPATIKLTVSYE